MGADLAPGMLKTYNEKVTANKWGDISSEVLDCRDLKTVKDGVFSHVITNFGFAPNVEDPEGPRKAAKEMWRVLKDGGLAVTSIWAGTVFFSFSM